jgi:DNA transposition AAA+ family ATPase
MNDPTNLKVDIDDQRDWLNAHKKETGAAWTALASRIGQASSTLSLFATKNYKGDNQKVADAIFRHRQMLTAQAAIAVEMPTPPAFFETPTSRRITTMLSIAQLGDMTIVAGGPGTSKSQTVHHYQASVSQVWVATMKPSTAGVNTMQIKVLEAMGERNAKGTPLALSTKIESLVRNTNGLLVLDEAQHLSEKALEEIRGWHDETGIGICLVGNEEVLTRLTLGNKRDAFARLASRIGNRLIFRGPTDGDAMALADAWDVQDDGQRAFLVDIAHKPGGLRTCTKLMKMACMLAASERSPLTLAHMQDAWAHLATRQLAA